MYDNTTHEPGMKDKMTVHRTISSCQKHTEYPRKYRTSMHGKKTAYAFKNHSYWYGCWSGRNIFAEYIMNPLMIYSTVYIYDMEQCSRNADLECLLLRNQLDWE